MQWLQLTCSTVQVSGAGKQVERGCSTRSRIGLLFGLLDEPTTQTACSVVRVYVLTCLPSLAPAFAEEEGEAAPQQQQELSAAESAALLRCLAVAERLPALNYGTLCRRLLRSHSGDAELHSAVGAFTAAQGSRQQQQYHLADFVAELLSHSSCEAAPEWQLQSLLTHLPQLLAALPEAQAVTALDTLCQRAAAPDASGQQALLQALLHALEPLLAGSCTPAVQQAAQQTVVSVLLPALPQPSRYPLSPTRAADDAQLSPQQRCWAAALRCMQQLPAAQLEPALQQPALVQQLPLHAAAVAAALVALGTLDARALQQPRNLLLSGSSQQQPLKLAAVLVGRAVGSLPAGQQVQWLLDVLDACKVRRGADACGDLRRCWLLLFAGLLGCSHALHFIGLLPD